MSRCMCVCVCVCVRGCESADIDRFSRRAQHVQMKCVRYIRTSCLKICIMRKKAACLYKDQIRYSGLSGICTYI